jgi:hypothetical protein
MLGPMIPVKTCAEGIPSEHTLRWPFRDPVGNDKASESARPVRDTGCSINGQTRPSIYLGRYACQQPIFKLLTKTIQNTQQ